MNLAEINSIPSMAERFGIKNLRFIIPLSRLHGGFLGLTYRSSGDPTDLQECVVDESRYRVEDGYKITLRAMNPLYGSETFYQSDLESMIRSYHRGERPRLYTVLFLSSEE